MKIISAALLDQAHNPSQIPSPPYPQAAVFGRSNVGKSSLLAKLMRRRKLVKISSTPGKTRAIYYYLINEALLLVDLPGYGFSKAPRAVANQWRSLVEAYLDNDPGPRLALHLIDIRHSPTKDDIAVHRILADRYIPCVTVATKADKLSRSAVSRATSVIGRELGEPVELILPTSAKDSSMSADPLWDRILEGIGLTP